MSSKQSPRRGADWRAHADPIPSHHRSAFGRTFRRVGEHIRARSLFLDQLPVAGRRGSGNLSQDAAGTVTEPGAGALAGPRGPRPAGWIGRVRAASECAWKPIRRLSKERGGCVEASVQTALTSAGRHGESHLAGAEVFKLVVGAHGHGVLARREVAQGDRVRLVQRIAQRRRPAGPGSSRRHPGCTARVPLRWWRRWRGNAR